ncbi:MAG: (Fe-S)-binding protein [Candidatus Omnitrophica bacterium]|nr:(Fe-S)-binding protein [Candidatus Omnitrophota bacterium]
MTNQDQYGKYSAGRLPGLNCGLCGRKSCEEFARDVSLNPHEIEKCVHIGGTASKITRGECDSCGKGLGPDAVFAWKDSLGREFDFILDTFLHEPGPRETILPHNPCRVKELGIQQGDILIGRPMGMSCGCPVTHCGIAMQVDSVNGIIVWCVTGPLGPRSKEHKDIGYYSAQAYEGMVKDAHKELKIGVRYWFLPRRCMLQWRHSGLVNSITKTGNEYRIRVEGLMIG